MMRSGRNDLALTVGAGRLVPVYPAWIPSVRSAYWSEPAEGCDCGYYDAPTNDECVDAAMEAPRITSDPPWTATAMTKDELDRYLATELICVVGVNRAGRAPLVFPMLFDWDGTRLRFTTYADSTKLPFIRNDRAISVVVESGTGRHSHRGVALEGQAEIVSDPRVAWGAREQIAARYPTGYLSPFPAAVEEWYERDYVLVSLVPERMRSWDFSKMVSVARPPER